MWVKGVQGNREGFSLTKTINKMMDIEGYVKEEEAKRQLYEFMRADVDFSARFLLGIKLFPFQEIMIKTMMMADYSMFVLSRGASKTFSAATWCLLEMFFFQGANIGVIASNFRQAKEIFRKIEKIISQPEARPILECLGGDPKKCIRKGSDMWELTLGRSKLVALPLANGDRLRGFRFNRIILDEFLAIPSQIFNEVILPFIGVVENPDERDEMAKLETELIARGEMEEKDRFKWPNNKLILLSSPSYKGEYMYQLYQKYVEMILGTKQALATDAAPENLVVELPESESAYRAIFQMGYDCLPKALYDANLLQQAKATMSEMQFKREFGAQFVDESDGYFRMSKLNACTIEIGAPAVEIAGEPSAEYIVSFDPSWSNSKANDDFAIHVFKLLPETQKSVLVHSYAIAGLDMQPHINYFLYLLQNFNIVGMVGDRNGGLVFIDACNASMSFKEKNIEIKVLDYDFDDPIEYKEDLRKMKNEINAKDRRYLILRNPSAKWNTVANQQLQASIDHRKILFASDIFVEQSGELLKDQLSRGVQVSHLIYSHKTDEGMDHAAKVIDFLDHQKAMIERTKQQCSNIEVKISPQGGQQFVLTDVQRKTTGPDRARKDSYSALVLGNWFIKIYYDMMNLEKEDPQDTTFTPFLI